MIQHFGEPVGELSEGFARVKLMPGESMKVRIDSWQLGSVVVHIPKGGPASDHIALGIAGERLDKHDHITKWSFTTRYLIDWLLPRLENRQSPRETYTLTVEGRAPVKISHALIEPAAV
jgi:hypothetical protein